MSASEFEKDASLSSLIYKRRYSLRAFVLTSAESDISREFPRRFFILIRRIDGIDAIEIRANVWISEKS
jgi:hypothetical protein